MPCSITDGEEGFGSDVLCSACWFDDIPTKEETTNSRVENNENQQPEEKNEIFNEEIIQNTDFGNKQNFPETKECEDRQANNLEETKENSDSEEEHTSKKIRHSFTIEKKLEILQYAKKSGKHLASRHYNVPRINIQRWVKQEQYLESMMK